MKILISRCKKNLSSNEERIEIRGKGVFRTQPTNRHGAFSQKYLTASGFPQGELRGDFRRVVCNF